MVFDVSHRIQIERKIEEALRSGDVERSLQNTFSGLSELPKLLGRLTQLRSLNLAENRLLSLPESLANLSQLQVLDLSLNRLDMLPKFLFNLRQLQTLYLSRNNLVECSISNSTWS